jgi:predicted Zn-dependent protease with MMP-like domain
MVDCSPQEFAALVTDALDDLPRELGELMHNVAVVVDDDSPPGALFGAYDGVPLTERGNEYGAVLPDRIVLFRQTLCAAVSDADELREEIVVTVVHEVAHHFGIDDDRLDELGWA